MPATFNEWAIDFFQRAVGGTLPATGATGPGTAAAATRVTYASDGATVPTSVADAANVTQGAIADAAYTTGSGTVVSLLKGLFGKFTLGAGTAAAAVRVTYPSDGATVPTSNAGLLEVLPDAYETVAASATAQILGATGAVGDFLSGVLIVPGTTAAGAVSIIDGNGSNISIFAGGGTTALTTLIPFFVPIGAKCVNATTPGWKVTTGANVTAIGVGNFT
jgi:hypothetical protein